MKSLNDRLNEIEGDQASLARTIEESKMLLNRSQQLLDCHRKQTEQQGRPGK